MPTAARFVATEIAPLMKSAGFRRRGSEFALAGPEDQIGVVAVRPNNRGADGLLGLSLSYGVVVPALRSYREFLGVRPFSFPAVDEALVWKEVRHPFEVVPGENTYFFPFRWALPDEQAARMGELMRRALEEEVIPGVRELFDTEVQVKMLRLSPESGVRGFESTAGEVLARLRYGVDHPSIRAAIARLNAFDVFGRWLQTQLSVETTEAHGAESRPPQSS